MTRFNTWLDTFVDEKGLDREDVFEVEGDLYGTNSIPLGCVIEAMQAAPATEQHAIQDTLVRLDFNNADCRDFFRHCAQALAI